MYYLNSICFVCLSNKSKLSAVCHKETQNDVIYALPELTILNPDNDINICSSCHTTLRSYTMFKKKCLDNYNRLNDYLKILQESSGTQDHSVSELQIRLINCDQLIKHENNINLNIKENEYALVSLEQQQHHRIEINDINMKEESIASEDKADQDFYQHLVKSESVSDDEQDGDSSYACEDNTALDKNKTNSNTDIGSQDFQCLLCNEVFTDRLTFHTHLRNHINNFTECTKPDPKIVVETPKNKVPQSNGREDESSEFYDSDSEYIPSECSSPETGIKNIKQATDEVEVIDLKELAAPATNVVALPTGVPHSKSKRKHYFCIYCKNTYAKLSRHLLQIHRHEIQVKEILALSKNSPKRKLLLEKIRNQGTFEFNTNVEYNAGQLIVSRRPNPNKQRSANHYIPCKYCLNYYSKLTIHKHYKYCSPEDRNRRDIQAFGRKIIQRLHPRANELMREKICPVLQPGVITDIVCCDELIILFGNKLTCKYKQSHLNYHIRQILRTLARFVIVLREIKPLITDLKSVYEPTHFDSVIIAVNKMAKLNPLTNKYEIPSLITRLGSYIKKCAHILIIEYIKKAETEKELLVEDFIKLFVDEYSSYNNKTTL